MPPLHTTPAAGYVFAIPHRGWDIFVYYAWLGLGAAALIGPVNIELARRTLRGGFWQGFALGCGAITVDITYALLSSLSLAPLVKRPAVQWLIGIGGFLLLVYLGVQSLRSARTHLESDPLSEAAPPSLRHYSFPTGVLMTLLNPITLIFWFIEVPAHSAMLQGTPREVPMIGLGVFIGTFAWVVGYAGFMGWLGQWRKRWWLAAADRLGGVILLALAVFGLWHLIRHSL